VYKAGYCRHRNPKNELKNDLKKELETRVKLPKAPENMISQHSKNKGAKKGKKRLYQKQTVNTREFPVPRRYNCVL